MVVRLCIVLLAVCGLSAANAGTIQFLASGTLSNSGGLGVPPFPNGTPISFELYIDSSTPDSDPLDTSRGVYSGLTGTFTLAGQTYSIDTYGYREVRVANNVYTGGGPTGFQDELYLWIGTANFGSPDTPVFNGARLHRMVFVLRSTNGSAISSDALGNALGLSHLQFPGSLVNMQTGDSIYINADAVGPATGYAATVVPVPAAAWLFGGAIGLLGLLGRRRAS